MTPRTVIVGGGLAGLAAGVRLADRGIAVQMLESRDALGGRASSVVDPATGRLIDNCQHVAMGCCSAYRGFCDRLGVGDKFRWTTQQWWHEKDGRVSVLKSVPGLGPLHSGWSFARSAFLTSAEKLAVARAFSKFVRWKDESLKARTFGDVLDELRQPAGAIEKFWRPVIVSACNIQPELCVASLAVKVFRDGIMPSAHAASVGVPTVPLRELYDASIGIIERAGGSVRTKARVFHVEQDGVRAHIDGDEQTLEADAVICATPPEVTADLLAASDPRVDALRSIEHSPILGVHLEFDRPALETPHAVLLERGTHWLFRKDDEGRRLHAVISAADEWMPMKGLDIVDRVVEDVRAVLPAARDAELVWSRAIKERRATFAATPAFEQTRVANTSDDAGVILAGCYTDTGWPATMEGAVRSGERAAAIAAERLAAVPTG